VIGSIQVYQFVSEQTQQHPRYIIKMVSEKARDAFGFYQSLNELFIWHINRHMMYGKN